MKTKQSELIDNVYEHIQLNSSYFLLLLFATIIATLGLLTDKIEIILGAMLISPLFWPVMGIALGVISTRKKIANNSFISLILSIALVLFISALITAITPVNEISSQIRSRTNPTLIDLFIAIAVSVIGVLALVRKRISESTTGVAVSIALLPPLCVAGIGIAKNSAEILNNAMLLFITNIGAIIFAGVITLYLTGIKPKRRKEEKTFSYGILLSTLLMILISIPLSVYLKDTLKKTQLEKSINTIIKNEISNIDKRSKIEEIKVIHPTNKRSKNLNVEANILLPNGIYITESVKNELLEKLVSSTQNNIDLRLDIVNTVLLQKDEDNRNRILELQLKRLINEEIKEISTEIIIERIDISLPKKIENEKEGGIRILILIRLFNKNLLTFDHKTKLIEMLEKHSNQPITMDIEFIPTTKLNKPNEKVKLYTNIKELLVMELGKISKQISINDIKIIDHSNDNLELLTITNQIHVPDNVEIGEENINEIQMKLEELTNKTVILNMQIFTFQDIQSTL